MTPDHSTIPLIVDLDGTLTPTDTLFESIIQLIKTKPWSLLLLPLWFLAGRATFKGRIARHIHFSAESLPYRESLLNYLQAEKARGRTIVLATAAHRSIADSVARKLGLFDAVLATEDDRNLKGRRKLEAIEARYGNDFCYAGDSAADLPIWKASRAAILVGRTSRRMFATVRAETPVEKEFPQTRAGLKVWLKALRLHQWLKNILIFVPLITSFSFTHGNRVVDSVLAFIAFSVAASATYLVNDLWDLAADRAHPRKCKRPLASAAISIPQAVALAGGMLVLSLGLGYAVSPNFMAMVLLYIGLTSVYSWSLKFYALIDVMMLALLFTLRILAGSVAIGVVTSSWLLAFSVFIFLSLALVKRCSELVSLQQMGRDHTHGRDYRVTDLAVLWPMGAASAMSAVVVLGLFIATSGVQDRFATGELLWLAAMGMIYWLMRLWMKTARGEMHDDPLVFAIRDRGSRIVIVTMICITVIAHSFQLRLLN